MSHSDPLAHLDARDAEYARHAYAALTEITPALQAVFARSHGHTRLVTLPPLVATVPPLRPDALVSAAHASEGFLFGAHKGWYRQMSNTWLVALAAADEMGDTTLVNAAHAAVRIWWITLAHTAASTLAPLDLHLADLLATACLDRVAHLSDLLGAPA